jgi:spore maturation protein CgeB
MSQFDDNLAVIAAKNPSLADAVRKARGGRLSVESSRSGLPTARLHGRWVHSAYDPVAEAAQWAEAQRADCQPGELIVLFGVGLLYQAEALTKHLADDFAFLLVVPDEDQLHDAATTRRWGPALDRWEWAWGKAEAIADRIVSFKRPIRLLTYRPAAASDEEVYRQIEQQMRRHLSNQSGGRVHVALIGPIYGGSLPIARYSAAALESLGHRVTHIDHSVHLSSYQSLGTLRDPRHGLAMQSKFAELLSRMTLAHLAEDPPDVVLALAQAPVILPMLELLRKKQFLTAMWFVENYRHLTYWQQLAGGFEFWFVIQKDGCSDALRRAGARHVSYLPTAADPAVHHPVVLTPVETDEFKADVSFVGAGYANRRKILPDLLGQPWTFKLWGNEWEGADSLRPVLQRQGARIDTETCVKVFNGTKVNLNLHSWNGPGLDPEGDFVNPRTFELAACGAFQLVDRRSLLGEHFTDGEVSTFASERDLPAAIGRWLREPEARAAIASAARRRVLAEHTYEHRMKELLSAIGMHRPDRVGSLLRGDRQAERLVSDASTPPTLASLLATFPPTQRVELNDLADCIRSKGPTVQLSRDELLVLMLDAYREETRDLI